MNLPCPSTRHAAFRSANIENSCGNCPPRMFALRGQSFAIAILPGVGNQIKIGALPTANVPRNSAHVWYAQRSARGSDDKPRLSQPPRGGGRGGRGSRRHNDVRGPSIRSPNAGPRRRRPSCWRIVGFRNRCAGLTPSGRREALWKLVKSAT